jgi:hypothetical protein
MFALNFVIEKRHGKTKHLNLRKFIRQHSMPFLIIYSNDTQSISLDQLDNMAEKITNDEVIKTGNMVPVPEKSKGS